MTTVIYHSADYDGIFCREIAKKFLGEKDVNYIGWNFGDPPIIGWEDSDTVYVMDLPPDEPFGISGTTGPDPRKVIWIDHHVSSIKKFETHNINGYRIDGVAACRLAWQWFNRVPYPAFDKQWCELPCKEYFIARTVREPLAVRLAGEYDVWDKRDPDADTFQYALRAEKLTPVGWAALFDGHQYFLNDLLVKGRVCQRYAQDVDASIVTTRSFMLEWEGLKWLTMNAIRCNSLSFLARDVLETGHDALLAFYFNGKCWTVSMYHARHRMDLDLSEIAKRYGGGGHRGACGFTCKKLPFDLE